jgi:hypothetical protein
MNHHLTRLKFYKILFINKILVRQRLFLIMSKPGYAISIKSLMLTQLEVKEINSRTFKDFY